MFIMAVVDVTNNFIIVTVEFHTAFMHPIQPLVSSERKRIHELSYEISRTEMIRSAQMFIISLVTGGHAK